MYSQARLENKNVVLLCRASDMKQEIYGDSLDGQLELGKRFIKLEKGTMARMFPLIESGADKERKYFEEVLDYCKNPKNKIDAIVFKDISRFTRAGSRVYQNFKVELAKYNIELVDISNIIQPERNTLEHTGFKYEWSMYSPSDQAEIAEAERHKAARRDLLTLMIAAEIRYLNLGYATRPPVYGLKNIKVETEHGIRSVAVPDEKEFPYIKKCLS